LTADLFFNLPESKSLVRISFPTTGHDFTDVIGCKIWFLHSVSIFQLADELMIGFRSLQNMKMDSSGF
jgi:hypothetical protein